MSLEVAEMTTLGLFLFIALTMYMTGYPWGIFVIHKRLRLFQSVETFIVNSIYEHIDDSFSGKTVKFSG